MSELIKIITGYCDDRGYPGTIQSNGTYDGGDTAAIIGTIESLTDPPWDIPGLPYFHSGFDIEPTRHWDTTKWYGQPSRFSRDQLIPNICSGIAPNQVSRDTLLLKILHKQRYFLTAWNTLNDDGSKKSFPASLGDICGPEIWALWIRQLNPWWAFLVLWFLDIQTLIGAIQWRWFTPQSNQITRNHMLVCLATIKRQPSVTSKLVCRINDWSDLVGRWELCNKATGEYPTYPLFQAKLKELGLIK